MNSLAKPGGNLTGVSFEAAPEARSKQLELMKEMMPRLARVAALWNSATTGGTLYLDAGRNAAHKLKISLRAIDISQAGTLDHALATVVKENLEALVVLPDTLTYFYRHQIVSFAETNHLPAAYGFREMMGRGD